MEPATLFLVTTLASGQVATQPLREYQSYAECQAFVAKVAENRPERLANKRHECRRHYKVSR